MEEGIASVSSQSMIEDLSFFAVLNCFFGFREIAMVAGTISVSRESLEYVLTQQGAGHSVVIMIGGPTEVLNTAPSLYHLVINKRKGFVRLALETGYDLFSFLFYKINRCVF